MQLRRVIGVLALASVMVMFAGCGQKGGSTAPVQEKSAADKMREEIELARLQNERDSIRAIGEINKKEGWRTAQMQGQRIEMPCERESRDTPEWMGAYGVVEVRDNNDQFSQANTAAQNELATRLIGVIQNSMRSYMKNTTVPSGNSAIERQLEGGAQNIARRVLDKWAEVACRDLVQNERGVYIAHVALRISKASAINEIVAATASEVREVDINADMYRRQIREEFEREYGESARRVNNRE